MRKILLSKLYFRSKNKFIPLLWVDFIGSFLMNIFEFMNKGSSIEKESISEKKL